MYSQIFWEHARHPRNHRVLIGAKTGEARYHRCGDKLTLYLTIENGLITQATFQAKGCAPVVAVASLATEMVSGLDVDKAGQLNIFEIDKELGGIPPSKRHAYVLFLECLKSALDHHKAKDK
ncbi:MAG: iron-sulfur cluster assembly scaffold protein [Candidatus Eremiobacteraeota bacterium]|nr:iron-sulfur cluster assembly scaffold protein [Candidatus Eremiobacteraeota bacterium]